ncbi:hypothetical protein [Micromonospora tulbaghiae]|uniref:hypothetical protein n=1 Tax=Micromonospora tulbaghiae TaxID=479978 RepID=UPI001FD1EA8C|nr:hypothetical protein [Micromonospora tulbaghiae]
MTVEIVTLAQRPDLAPLLDADFDGAWPPFMLWNPMGAIYYGVAHETYPEFVFAAVDPAEPGRAVARGYAVPLRWTEDELPDGGWDRVIQRATLGRLTGSTPNLVSALEICVRPDRRGGGLSGLMLAAMRAAVAGAGFDTLVAPVRPNGKAAVPDVAPLCVKTLPGGAFYPGFRRVRVVTSPKSRLGDESRSRWSQLPCPVVLPGPPRRSPRR